MIARVTGQGRGRPCPIRPSGGRPGSCISDLLGQVLAGPARDGEEILFADLDLDEIARGKFDFDVVGHYA